MIKNAAGIMVEDLSRKGWRKAFLLVSLMVRFTIRFFKEVWRPPYEFNEIVKQSYQVGYKSLPLVGITAFIMGLVLTVQFRPSLADFGAVSWLPSLIALSLIKEIGPVITALICAGKVGSSIGAELSSMKVTEQIDAMEVSGANPFNYLVVTRVISTTLMIPMLVIFADAIGLIGSFAAVNITDSMGFKLFLKMALASVDFFDVLPAFIKTIFFGLVIGIVGTYQGYNSENGTEGVGKAATSAVIIGSLMVFIIDMIAVQITALFS
jgi:phospholipid/cholesterol/gamma-HCH transport system permease protein